MAPLPALATAADLAKRLQVTEPAAGTLKDAWDAALLDASNTLREIIGQPITAGTSTLDLDVCRHTGLVRIPLNPVRNVTAVQDSDGTAIDAGDYRWRGQRLTFYCGLHRFWPNGVRLTITHGWTDIPGDILKWVYVLAAGQLAASARGNLGLTGGLTSVGIDDGRASFSDAPVDLPDHVKDQLRANYGGEWL